MSLNTGTLITATIRPNSSLDEIATVFGNESKGGHHSYVSLAERNNIMSSRREWGMLCTVYNDAVAENNKTYQLKYGYSNTNINDNNNWIIYTPSNNTNIDTGEWESSVKSILNDPSSITPIDGDRYLIITGFASFAGKNNNIAQWSSNSNGGLGSWIFTTPKEGMVVRLDDTINAIYMYNSSSWNKELINQVRFISATSSNGISYSFTSNGVNKVNNLSESVFYTSFNVTSSNTISLNIDNLGHKLVKKINNNTLVNIESNDIVTGLQYQLLYNPTTDWFQTTLPASQISTIGPAENGTYTDGLFTDFDSSTAVGIPIDRYNVLFKALVPPSAPQINSLNITSTTGFVSGKLSFNGTDSGFISGTNSIYGGIAKNGIFPISGNRYGIYNGATQTGSGSLPFVDIIGTINNTTLANNATPFPAFIANSFGNANNGTMSLILNGVTVSSVSLTNLNSINTTSGNVNSGLILSSATSSKFPGGAVFETFYNRTGTYLIKRDDSRLLNGLNHLTINHNNVSINRLEFVRDNSNIPVTFDPAFQTNLTTFNGRKISGIAYNTTYSFKYNVTIKNVYTNTYNSDSDAILITDNRLFVAPVLSDSSKSVGDCLTPSDDLSTTCGFIIRPSINVANNSSTITTRVKKTVQGTFTGGTYSLSNLFLNTMQLTTSTNTIERFDDEEYRLRESSYTSYTTTASVIDIDNKWDSSISLVNNNYSSVDVNGVPPNKNQINGLLVMNGTLSYPSIDYSVLGTTSSNPNFGVALANYSGASVFDTTIHPSSLRNLRMYVRKFVFTTSKQNFNCFIEGNSCGLASIINPITGNNGLMDSKSIFVEFKLPSQTGWMNGALAFQTGNVINGAGCLSGTITNNTTNPNFNITFGTYSSANSANTVLIRITANSNWSGNISQITMT